MVYKENERKTPKKKTMGKWSNGRRKGKKRECTKPNMWSTVIFPSLSQSNTLKGLLSHLNQGCTEVKILS